VLPGVMQERDIDVVLDFFLVLYFFLLIWFGVCAFLANFVKKVDLVQKS
jgi:hypothetical protein